jgi:hypothetical protein
VALRPLQYLDGLTIPDDAYLSLTIARNIAKGLGPWYGAGLTNGFQPLYVFMMAPVYFLFDDPAKAVHVALIRLTIFDTLTLFVLLRMVAAKSRSLAAPLIVAAAWILNPTVIGTTLNGLETAVSFFFIVSAFSFIANERHRELKPRAVVSLGVLVGLAILARIDNVFLAVAIVGAVAWKGRAIPRPLLLRKIALLLLTASLVVAPWLVYSYAYTGELFPVSGKAVRLMSLSSLGHDTPFLDIIVTTCVKAVGVLYAQHRLLLWLLIPLAGGLAFLKPPQGTLGRSWREELAPVILFCALLFLAYTGYILTFWYYPRYLYPLILPLILTLALVVDAYDRRIVRAPVRAAFFGSVALALVAGNVARPELRALYSSTDTLSQGYMNLGLWAKGRFAPGTVIGSSQSGALGYFADSLTVINLDGVVNSECYRSLVERRNIDYIRKAKVAYVVGWGSNIDFIVRHSANIRREDLILEGAIPGFTSWGKEWLLIKVNDRR